MSEPVYWKVSTNYRDGFTYNVTGLADGAFTKELTKNGVNVSSPPGITITNISSGTRYDVSVDGASGFVSATGVYHLVIYRTAIPNDRWESIIAVTSSGLPDGTFGTANFTATTGDGRVTDGSNPIQNATVYIRRPSGALYAVLTTNSSGLWGPVYFDENGTYSITAQASGYTVGSGSLTVTGLTTVTGPGADIALTASSIAGATLASTLWAYARRMFHSRNGTKADTEVRESVNEAVRQLCNDKDWPWLYTVGRLNFKAAYTTGTVTVTESSAVVTLAGGTFPTWAASGEIFIAGQWHSILTRDSNTQLTLDNAWASPDTDGSGLGYVLAQYQYTLPSDCRTVVNINPQNNWLWGNVPCSRWQIEMARTVYGTPAGTQTGYMHAIERDRLVVWPYPSEDLMVNVLYVKAPAALTSSTDTVDWDPNQMSLLYRAIDYQIALRGECVAGSAQDCYARYQLELQRVFSNDRGARPRTVGFIDRGSMGSIPPAGSVINL